MNAKKSRPTNSNQTDIIKLLLEDHVPLKKLVKFLKNPHLKISEKRPSFEKFATQLLTHAKSEEQSLYSRLQGCRAELRVEGFEGLTEHAIAENLIEEIRVTTDKNEWLGKVKVLAEIVEHHLLEEESTMFRTAKREFSQEMRNKIGDMYLKQKEEYEEYLKSFRKRAKMQKPTYELESTL